MACDLAVMVDDAFIRHVGLEHGSVPAGGATQWLPVFVGDRRAREIIFLCEEIPARRPRSGGWSTGAVPAAELDAKVDEVVEKLAAKLPQTTRYAKQQLNFWRDLVLARDGQPRARLARAVDARRRGAGGGARHSWSRSRDSSSSSATTPIAVVLLNRPQQLNALSGELMDELVAGAAGARRGRRRSAASSSAAPSGRSQPAPTSASSRAGTPIVAVREPPHRSLGRDPQPAHAARRGRVGLLPRRRLRARDDVRPDRRVRDRALRPARDQPRRHPRRRRHAAADAGSRQGGRDGHDPHRTVPRRGGGARPGLVARVVAQEAWLDEAKRVAREIAAKSPVALRLAKEAVDRAFEAPLSAGSSTSGARSTLARASEDADEGLTAFVEKRQPDFKGR